MSWRKLLATGLHKLGESLCMKADSWTVGKPFRIEDGTYGSFVRKNGYVHSIVWADTYEKAKGKAESTVRAMAAKGSARGRRRND